MAVIGHIHLVDMAHPDHNPDMTEEWRALVEASTMILTSVVDLKWNNPNIKRVQFHLKDANN